MTNKCFYIYNHIENTCQAEHLNDVNSAILTELTNALITDVSYTLDGC